MERKTQTDKQAERLDKQSDTQSMTHAMAHVSNVLKVSVLDPLSQTNQPSSPVNKGPFQSIESFLSTSFDLTTQALKTLSYHEMAEVPLFEEDGLDQLRRNIQTLSTATAKLRFMNREIRYILKI